MLYMKPTGEAAYLGLLARLIVEGDYREGRNGRTFSLFGEQLRFDLRKGFPLLTTKKVHFKSVLIELLWFLRGDTNVRYLREHGVTIWDEWADPETGELGPVYGRQWRRWEGKIDQIANLIKSLKETPNSRRHIVSAWNPSEVDDMALPPCHCLFQFYVSSEQELSCHLYQRSADIFLGVPFNIASYALLTHLIAQVCGYSVGELVLTFGDVHLYDNHMSQASIQIARGPKAAPVLALDCLVKDIDAFRAEHVTLLNYDPHPAIKAEVSV